MAPKGWQHSKNTSAKSEAVNMAQTQIDFLNNLRPGGRVAVVTMTGSCCPVTLAHIQAFVESRQLLLSRGYDCVLGGLSLNPDRFVSKKLIEKGLPSISQEDRAHLVHLAIQDYPWMQYNSREWRTKGGSGEEEFCSWHQQRWPHLVFDHFLLNGADDVIRRQKWKWTRVRQIVMCRPGVTEELMLELQRGGVDTNGDQFIVGPELPDISSTEVRQALANGDQDRLLQLVHSDVAHWCWVKGPYRPKKGSVWNMEAAKECMAVDASTSNQGSEDLPRQDVALRQDAAKSIHRFVCGVLNGSWKAAQIIENLASISSEIALWTSAAPSFVIACDALADAIVEGLVPAKGIAVLNSLADRLPDHGVLAGASLLEALSLAECSSATNRRKRWQKSAGVSASIAAQSESPRGASLEELHRLCSIGTVGEETARASKARGSGGSKGQRAVLAHETLNILTRGRYVAPNSQEIVEISSTLCQAVGASTHFPAAASLKVLAKPDKKSCKQKLQVEVHCCTVLEAVQELARCKSSSAAPGVLNFASARNPGGGFTTGAEAQEESLARSSGIYPCLSKHFQTFFLPNRQTSSGLYTHDLIFSPGVPVLRDEYGVLLEEPYLVDFVTAAAPNCGVLEERYDVQEAARQCRLALNERVHRVLHTFASHGCMDLVLGAWGCGVFRNDPATVAALFHEVLNELGCFRRVIFAVLDPRMAQTFANEFRVSVKGVAEKENATSHGDNQRQDSETDNGANKGTPQVKHYDPRQASGSDHDPRKGKSKGKRASNGTNKGVSKKR